MSETNILSEKLEDNQAAAEWGQKQAELIKKGETITKRLTAKYIPIILERDAKEITDSDKWGKVLGYLMDIKNHNQKYPG